MEQRFINLTIKVYFLNCVNVKRNFVKLSIKKNFDPPICEG